VGDTWRRLSLKSDGRIDKVQEPRAVAREANVLDDLLGQKIGMGPARHVGRHECLGMVPIGMVGGQRLLVEDAERRRLIRGIFHSSADLQAAINHYLEDHNDVPKPFVWTKSTDQILEKIDRTPEPTV
jgi:hypothetical protein